jgi:hypothetical protein
MTGARNQVAENKEVRVIEIENGEPVRQDEKNVHSKPECN